MKYCASCGAELAENAKFCSNCAAPIPQQEPAAPAWDEALPGMPVPEKKKKFPVIFIILGILVLLGAAIACFMLFGRSSTEKTYTNEDLQLVTDFYSPDGTLLSSESRGFAGNATTTYTHDEKGHLAAGSTRSSRDGISRHIFTCDTDGNVLKKETRTMMGEKIITTYTYENGVRTSATVEELDTTYVYTFHANGNVATEEKTAEDGYRTYTVFTCDGKNQLQSGAYESSGGFRGNITYIYDDAGNMTHELLVYDDGYTATKKYSYSKTGQVLTSSTTFSDGSWERFTNSYDEAGNRFMEVFESSEGEYISSTYSFDENGRRMFGRGTSGDGESWDFTCTYDTNGDLAYLEKVFQSGDRSAISYQNCVRSSELWVFEDQGRMITEFDENGRETSTTTTFADGGTVTNFKENGRIVRGEGTFENGESYSYTYDYDEDGNKIRENVFFADGDAVTNTFDTDGNKISADFKFYEGGGCIVTYDKEGNKISEKHY